MINDFNITGNLTADPRDLSKDGKTRVGVTIAKRRSAKTTHFISLIAYDKTAEHILKYLKKGEPVTFSGIINPYVDKQTNEYKVNHVIREVEFIRGATKSNNEKVKKIDTLNSVDKEVGDQIIEKFHAGSDPRLEVPPNTNDQPQGYDDIFKELPF